MNAPTQPPQYQQQHHYQHQPIPIAPSISTIPITPSLVSAPSSTVSKPATSSSSSGSKIVGKPPVISLHTIGKKTRPSSSSSRSSNSSIMMTSMMKRKTASSPPPQQQQRTPLEVLRSIFFQESSDPNTAAIAIATKLSFRKPNEEDIAAYDIESVRAVRSSNLEQLQELHVGGKSLDACNPFGESLLHMACRRGDSAIVKFLLVDAGVKADRCDDFGRNPFHDALWTSTPNLDVVDLLIDHVADSPSLLLAEDVRGNTPFAYARREHDAKWIAFLEQRREKLRQRGSAALAPTSPEAAADTSTASASGKVERAMESNKETAAMVG